MTPSLGPLLRQARESRGLTLDALARQLNLQASVLRALEEDDWGRLPRGRERPLARQVAGRLGLDLEAHTEAWAALPGELAEEPLDPRQERMERTITLTLAAASLAVLVWLLMPGPNLRKQVAAPVRAAQVQAVQAPRPAALAPGQDYPVLGEALPEAPATAEGVLVVLRVQDPCEAKIQGDQVDLTRTLQVSQPWKVRVKGAFQVQLTNAGVTALEVAGRRIRHGQSVGESWSGRFTADGSWIQPQPADDLPPTRPDVDPDSPEPEPAASPQKD